MKNIVVFCSGSGSNFVSIYGATKKKKINGRIVLVVSNKKDCKAIDFAKKNKIEVYIQGVKDLSSISKDVELLNILIEREADLLVLAGYLKLVPVEVVKHFHNRMLNIHPSLLPKYGGQGFYGQRVHQAVIDSKDIESGITIHFVNERYDEGSILFQKRISISGLSSAFALSKEILKLEHHYYSKVIELFCLDKIKWKNNKPILIDEKDFQYETCNN